MDQHTMEILAPAGDEEMLRAAVFSGASCVYLGINGFNARRSAANFEGEGLRQAVAFCHARGCKVYAALNTLVLPGREQAFVEAVRQVAAAGCDAVIVQDLGAAALVRSVAPGLALHGSTQMSVHSLGGVQQLAALGFSRVILARELRREELQQIAAHSPIELEVFVHGALCVSVSGQCMMSAFLGGRSANRGGCAGPCRLPFRAACGQDIPRSNSPAEASFDLSLKDLSILDALPELARMGIVSAKIEGRLRGPEYCAVAVDSARKARDGQPYDRELLRHIFSRSGFTAGWYTGRGGADMFGVRTPEDAAATKKALPKARALYRREMARVPVRMRLTLHAEGGDLGVEDGTHTVRIPLAGPLPLAANSAPHAQNSLLRKALQKTGGTPFFVVSEDDITLEDNGFLLSPPAAGELRRLALDELLRLRGLPGEHTPVPNIALPAEDTPVQKTIDAVLRTTGTSGAIKKPSPVVAEQAGLRPVLRARFEHVRSVPQNADALCEELILPLFEADLVPNHLRAKTRLWLPRVLFGAAEKQAEAEIARLATMGFRGYEAQNIAHLWLCKGADRAGGFGLNLTNAVSVAVASQNGCTTLTLSPELRLSQMRQICSAQQGGAALDALCYGHVPLMLTRACPLWKKYKSCAACPKSGLLIDRKGVAMQVACRDGARSIYNPVPLWMADRLGELPTATATLYFTGETLEESEQILQAFQEGRAAPGAFTRGLYDKGTAEL